jgi:hypothetical protein
LQLAENSRQGTFGYLARSRKNMAQAITAPAMGVSLPSDARIAKWIEEGSVWKP